MANLFLGLEIARRALAAHQQALDVTSHNVANANTPGYSRQLARLTATPPWPGVAAPTAGLPAQLGTGVEVAEVHRARDAFLDRQIRFEHRQAGRWEVRRDALEQVELLFDEPSDRGLQAALNGLWAAFQDLADRPADLAVRETVLEQAETVAAAFRRLAAGLAELQANIDRVLRLDVGEVNGLAREIASLNEQVRQLTVAGDSPNDLLDKQDLALTRLSRYADIRWERDTATGMLTVWLGTDLLVEAGQARQIAVVDSPPAGFALLRWSDTGTDVTVNAGRLNGLLEMRDTDVPDTLQRLDGLAAGFVQAMNGVHKQGYNLDGATDQPLFSGDSAANVQLDPTIVGHPERLAAAKQGTAVPGDGSNALELANLFETKLFDQDFNLASPDNELFTVGEAYRALIGELGVRSREARTELERSEAVIRHLDRRQQETAGVSLDEEMTNLLLFQHGYNAAARVVTAIDEMLDTVIRRMGLAGR